LDKGLATLRASEIHKLFAISYVVVIWGNKGDVWDCTNQAKKSRFPALAVCAEMPRISACQTCQIYMQTFDDICTCSA
jgi:hypothetical protein